jgi:hypothetical protein
MKDRRRSLAKLKQATRYILHEAFVRRRLFDNKLVKVKIDAIAVVRITGAERSQLKRCRTGKRGKSHRRIIQELSGECGLIDAMGQNLPMDSALALTAFQL